MKNYLRNDLHSLLKQWWKPKVTARRRKQVNRLDLFKECEHNTGERIGLIQKGLKLKRNMRLNTKKCDQGWESSCHSLWHKKKAWTGKHHGLCDKVQLGADPLGTSVGTNSCPSSVVLRTPVWPWCSPWHGTCALTQHIPQKFYCFSLFPLSWWAKECHSQALSDGICVSLATLWNSHTTWCFCCPSLTRSLGQRDHSKEHS